MAMTAGGHNEVATCACIDNAIDFIDRVMQGEVIVVIDDDFEALDEYGGKLPSEKRSEDLAGQFLIYLYNYQGDEERVRRMKLKRDSDFHYIDYPDNEGSWKTDVPRCKQFDEDDKKWVALARRFKIDTGADAPIVNAADRCWLAFESYLNATGIMLEFLCREERKSGD
ncbi:MAG: hypothetical protein OXE46_10160 [Chloroflexi bacterium]|nr:hypothetical protein [Chloroflexota bacterium]